MKYVYSCQSACECNSVNHSCLTPIREQHRTVCFVLEFGPVSLPKTAFRCRSTQNRKPCKRLICRVLHRISSVPGGETGIRTLGTLAGTTVFETAPIDHSGISPLITRTFVFSTQHEPRPITGANIGNYPDLHKARPVFYRNRIHFVTRHRADRTVSRQVRG